MSGAVGVMAIILLETAVGGAVALWASGVWGIVRKGFFLLTGSTIALCALGAWAITRSEAGSSNALTALAVFTGLTFLWLVLLAAKQETLAKIIGMVAAVAGVVALV